MKEIITEIKNINDSPAALRKFGVTIGIVLLLTAIILLILNKPFIIWGSLAILLILAAISFPLILRPFNKIWMGISIILGWIMTRVILSILFYLAFTSIRVIALAFNKKFLDFKIDPSAETYWEKREKKNIDPVNYERQF